MAEGTSALPVFNVELSFGPMLIGVFFNMILYGILIVQTYTYYQTYRNDTLWIRLFVGYLFVLETANTAFDMAMMWQPLIQGFGTQEAVKKFPTLFSTEPIVMVLISTPIQCFFAWRIQRITQSSWIPVFIVILSAASMAGGIWTGVKLFIIKLFARKPELHESALLWFLTSCVADVMITATLVRSLSQRKTGFVVTDSVIDKIIRLTVQTGMITAICAIGDVVFFMTLPRTALNFLWDLTLSKLYANCLFSTLNARASLNSMSGNVSSGQNQRNIQLEVGSNIRRQTDRYTVDSSRNSPGV
ncbi:hypothetical protein K435DRAFT_520009 [Dendrothele bispora CBS 962.96]|uniref:DUF6534 domain-containing protein n=1 Tax=Dendrothele bispora (strain CBS 962.96) TaxID=1314807 RepID=A0A4S8M9C2_DENBC|nr:hypothetical protein K435DRAFT_520009 [Dendrothele bispora CBS 962.96]